VAEASQPRYDVLSPLGRRATAPQASLADRLPDLTGRTVAFVWDHVFHGDRMLDRFSSAATQRFEGLSFVPHEEFGNIHGTAAEEHEAVELLPKRLRANGVDAAIVGVGA
jgi:hypothetical protein